MTSLDYQEFKKREREEPSVDTEPNDIGALLRNEAAPIEDRVANLIRAILDVIDF